MSVHYTNKRICWLYTCSDLDHQFLSMIVPFCCYNTRLLQEIPSEIPEQTKSNTAIIAICAVIVLSKILVYCQEAVISKACYSISYLDALLTFLFYFLYTILCMAVLYSFHMFWDQLLHILITHAFVWLCM